MAEKGVIDTSLETILTFSSKHKKRVEKITNDKAKDKDHKHC